MGCLKLDYGNFLSIVEKSDNSYHLGSITKVTSATGVIEAEQDFDPWGRRRDPQTLAYLTTWQSGVDAPLWLYRGYTGHEHLDELSLINMNARLYDPVVGQMLGPDNYVSDATSTQAYNRYSYCYNNPLKYTDPDGNEPVTLTVLAVAGLIGGTINLATNWNNINSFEQGIAYFGVGAVSGVASVFGAPLGGIAAGAGNAALGSFYATGKVDGGAVVQGAVMGGILSGITAGVGQALSPFAGKALSGISSRVLREALVQGGVGLVVGAGGGAIGAAMSGGDIGQGALSGAAWGLGIGLTSGAITGYQTARTLHENPWTGESFAMEQHQPIEARGIDIQQYEHPQELGKYQLEKIMDNGAAKYSYEVPSKNNSSKAVYQKYVGLDGQTKWVFKDAYNSDKTLNHRAFKFPKEYKVYTKNSKHGK